MGQNAVAVPFPYQSLSLYHNILNFKQRKIKNGGRYTSTMYNRVNINFYRCIRYGFFLSQRKPLIFEPIFVNTIFSFFVSFFLLCFIITKLTAQNKTKRSPTRIFKTTSKQQLLKFKTENQNKKTQQIKYDTRYWEDYDCGVVLLQFQFAFIVCISIFSIKFQYFTIIL